MSTEEDSVRDRIKHVLGVYPKISPSMLQIVIHVKPAIWRPIVDDMVKERIIKRHSIIDITPTGRNQSYTVLQLEDTVDVD